MKYLLATGVAAALVMGVVIVSSGFGTPSAQAQVKPPVLVNMTSGLDDLHAISMGLGIARNAAEAGHDVLVFLNVHTPVIAAVDFDESLQYGGYPPIKTMLANVLEAGAQVFVCDHCAEMCGVSSDSLIDGVTVSGHGAILDALTAGMIGFSY